MGIGEQAVLPEVLAQLRSDRSALVVFNGGTYELQGTDLNDTRAQAVQYITGLAAQIVGGPVQVTLTDPDGGGWQMVVTPEGDITHEAPADPPVVPDDAGPTGALADVEHPVAGGTGTSTHGAAEAGWTGADISGDTLPGSGTPGATGAPAADGGPPVDSAGVPDAAATTVSDTHATSATHAPSTTDATYAPPPSGDDGGPELGAAAGSNAGWEHDGGWGGTGFDQPADDRAALEPGAVTRTFRDPSQGQELPQAPENDDPRPQTEQHTAYQYPPPHAAWQEQHAGHQADQQHLPMQPEQGGPATSAPHPPHVAPAQTAAADAGHQPGADQWAYPPQPGPAPQPGYGGEGAYVSPNTHAPYPQHGAPHSPPVTAPPPVGPGHGQGVEQGHPTEQQVLRRRDLRESFLRTEQAEAPASTGMRGALTKLGIRTSPSAAERAMRADINAVSQHWPGVRTIAVVNGKGGANKTPTTALLAAVFARNSGAATLAWDNNETRGTLGWRTEQGKHEATVQDLLPEGDALLDPAAKAGDISHFVHHQAADKYDVLRSNPNVLSAEQRLTGDDVDLVHDVAGRYYRLIFIDSGNDESADHWLRMIDKADQLVVATIAKPEHAEAGALLLEALAQRGERTAHLARNAVVVVSQAREKDTNTSAKQIADGFTGWVREVVTIPYDRAMVEAVLHYDSLAPATQRAWLRAAAAVANGL